jgi:hypothetical protein
MKWFMRSRNRKGISMKEKRNKTKGTMKLSHTFLFLSMIVFFSAVFMVFCGV